MLVSDQFGFHDSMTGLAAELDGLGVMIGMIAAEGGNEQETNGADEEKAHQPTIARAGQIDLQRESGGASKATEFPPAQQNPQNCQAGSDHQEAGRDQVGQYANVGIGRVRQCVEQQQQQERKEAPQSDDAAGQRKPVAEEKGTLGSWRR